jgi:hypothetical protein
LLKPFKIKGALEALETLEALEVSVNICGVFSSSSIFEKVPSPLITFSLLSLSLWPQFLVTLSCALT